MFISFIAFGFLINDESVASFNADNHKHESKESMFHRGTRKYLHFFSIKKLFHVLILIMQEKTF